MSELHSIAERHRRLELLGKPCLIQVTNGVDIPFTGAVKAVRAAMAKAEEIAGRSLPWYEGTSKCDLSDEGISILCSASPTLGNGPQGFWGDIVICTWACSSDQVEPKPKPEPTKVGMLGISALIAFVFFFGVVGPTIDHTTSKYRFGNAMERRLGR